MLEAAKECQACRRETVTFLDNERIHTVESSDRVFIRGYIVLSTQSRGAIIIVNLQV